MALPAHLTIEPLGAYRVRLALRIVPSLAYIALTLVAISAGQPPLTTLLALIVLGLFAIAITGPLAVRRVRGFLELGQARREMLAANAQLEAGDADAAAKLYDSAAHRLAGRLHANHVVAISGAALAQAQQGHRSVALEILDQLDASGWHRAFSMRRTASAVRLGEAVARASLGDLPGARRALAQVRVVGAITRAHLDRVAALIAVLGNDADARERVEAALASSASERSDTLYLALGAFHASRTGQTELARTRLEALRARPKRDYAAIAAGWPELHAWLVENDLVITK